MCIHLEAFPGTLSSVVWEPVTVPTCVISCVSHFALKPAARPTRPIPLRESRTGPCFLKDAAMFGRSPRVQVAYRCTSTLAWQRLEQDCLHSAMRCSNYLESQLITILYKR